MKEKRYVEKSKKEEYYLALLGCSRGIQKSSILYVKDGKVDFHRGPTDDKFELDERGKPYCSTTRRQGGLDYNIIGPLSDEVLSDVLNEHKFGDFTKPKRLTSARQFH